MLNVRETRVVGLTLAVAAAISVGIFSFTGAIKPFASAIFASQPRQNSSGLQKTIDQFAAKQPDLFGIEIIDLKTGEVAAHNANRVFTTASIYKLFVADGILRQVDAGKITLESVDSCLKLMITISDNACGQSLGSKLGWNAVNPLLESQGFKSTSLQESDLHTTAANVARFFQLLYQGKLLSSTSTEYLLALLKAQKVNDRLPTGLPAGTVIAHKTGNLDGLLHDAGTVYGPKTDYVIVGLSGPWNSESQGLSAFTQLSSVVYHELD